MPTKHREGTMSDTRDPGTLFAAERTLLAYARTALGIAAAGVALFRLSVEGAPDRSIGLIGVIGGIVVALLGVLRFLGLRRRLIQYR